MSDHVATQLTAIFTGVLAVGAIVTAILAFLAFRTQFKEVRQLQKENTREAYERRRAQASRVFIWQEVVEEASQRQQSSNWARNAKKAKIAKVDLASGSRQVRLIIHVRNTSEQPVYELVIMSTNGSTSWTGKIEKDELLPGAADMEHARWARVPSHGPPGRDLYDAKVEFRDSAGVRWLRRLDGELTDLPNRAPQRDVAEQTS
jgi:hypothetical protein